MRKVYRAIYRVFLFVIVEIDNLSFDFRFYDFLEFIFLKSERFPM